VLYPTRILCLIENARPRIDGSSSANSCGSDYWQSPAPEVIDLTGLMWNYLSLLSLLPYTTKIDVNCKLPSFFVFVVIMVSRTISCPRRVFLCLSPREAFHRLAPLTVCIMAALADFVNGIGIQLHCSIHDLKITVFWDAGAVWSGRRYQRIIDISYTWRFLPLSTGSRPCASQRPVHRRLRGAYEFCRWINTPVGR
jgi:hypothetical protein